MQAFGSRLYDPNSKYYHGVLGLSSNQIKMLFLLRIESSVAHVTLEAIHRRHPLPLLPIVFGFDDYCFEAARNLV
jgi:hypothetical protein